MRLIERLLHGIDPQDQKDYESYVQLHLKQILTTINKNKLEDTTAPKVPPLRRRLGSTNA